AADGHQSPAQVTGGDGEAGDLVVRQAVGVDVDQDGGGVGGQPVDGGHLGRADDVDGDAAGPQGAGQGGADAGHAFDEEHPGRALDLDRGEAHVVLQAGVGRAADLEAVPGEGGGAAAGGLGQ